MDTAITPSCQTIVLLQRPEDLEVRLFIEAAARIEPDPRILVSEANPVLALENMVYVKKGDNEPTFRGTFTEDSITTLMSFDPRGVSAAMVFLKMPQTPGSPKPDIVFPLILTLLDSGARYIVGGRFMYDVKTDRFYLESTKMIPFEIEPVSDGGNGAK